MKSSLCWLSLIFVNKTKETFQWVDSLEQLKRVRVQMKPTTYVNDIFNSHQLTTTENTITYHNTLCWSLQHFAEELSLVSLGSLNGPKRNWKQCLCKIFEWPTKSIMVCYDIFCSGQFAVHRHTYTLVKNNKAVCKAPKKFECQLVTVYSFREPQRQCKSRFWTHVQFQAYSEFSSWLQ